MANNSFDYAISELNLHYNPDGTEILPINLGGLFELITGDVVALNEEGTGISADLPNSAIMVVLTEDETFIFYTNEQVDTLKRSNLWNDERFKYIELFQNETTINLNVFGEYGDFVHDLSFYTVSETIIMGSIRDTEVKRLKLVIRDGPVEYNTIIDYAIYMPYNSNVLNNLYIAGVDELGLLREEAADFEAFDEPRLEALNSEEVTEGIKDTNLIMCPIGLPKIGGKKSKVNKSKKIKSTNKTLKTKSYKITK